ncbi:MAG TPA: glycosyltransferase family 39 protein [Methanospirillum sp.]|nr:glycosyltransferase family 39 protein [Methanospirillum sp.]
MDIDHILKKYCYELTLVGIILVAGFLYLVNLSQNGYSNPYYAAAIKSMLTNPAISIWGSFDSAGFVTVDKPPVALWVQMTSVLICGYTGWALILPQALAGIISVILLYLVISRSYGKPSGLIAAFVLTITPIAVAVGRTNNLDGLLVCVLLLAFITAIEAWRRGSLLWLTMTAILVGIGFNIKMIEAFAVIPAFFGIYLLSRPIPLKKRILHLACAGAVLVVVSFSWAVMVDLTPSGERPYIGSSENNSALELIFGYNGLSRIIGKTDPLNERTEGFNRTMTPLNQKDDQAGDGMGGEPIPPSSDREEIRSGIPSPGMGGPDEAGSPGLLRLGNEQMAGQITWLLPFALIGLLAWIRRPVLSRIQNLTEQEILLCALLLWLVPELAYFSLSSGHFHLYYLVMVAPPLASLVGIGAVSLYQEYLHADIRGWLLVLAIPVTGIVQSLILLRTPEFSGILPWIILSGSLLIGGILAWIRARDLNITRRRVTQIVALGIGILFIAPALWSCTPLLSPGSGSIPVAGPDQNTGDSGPGGQNPGMPSQGTVNQDLIKYLQSHAQNETFLVGVESANAGGSDLIVKTGEAVMALGGFSGRDQILSKEALQERIRQGEIRYFFLTRHGGGMPGDSSEGVTTWIADTCPVVPDSEWNTNPTSNTTERRERVLYDCRSA